MTGIQAYKCDVEFNLHCISSYVVCKYLIKYMKVSLSSLLCDDPSLL